MTRAAAARAYPDTRQALLLRAALGEGDPARRAWEEFAAEGGRIEELDDASYRLLPQLYRNLEACGIDGETMIRLRGVYRHAWYRNQMLLHAAGSAVRALTAAGVGVMALKGAAVAALYPGGLGTRPMNDVDLLVGPADLDRAVAVLGAEGFAPVLPGPLAITRRVRHAVALRREDGIELDLHWHLLVHGDDDRGVWDRAVRSTLSGASILAPSPADQLLHTCVHGLAADPAPVRWIADAVLIIRSGVDWEVLVEEARDRDVTVVMLDSLRLLAREVGVAIPRPAIAALAGSRGSLAARLAHRAATGRFRSKTMALGLAYWDWYRRRERGRGRRPSPLGYASFVADTKGLPGRRALAREILRRTLAVGAEPPRGHVGPGIMCAREPTGAREP